MAKFKIKENPDAGVINWDMVNFNFEELGSIDNPQIEIVFEDSPTLQDVLAATSFELRVNGKQGLDKLREGLEFLEEKGFIFFIEVSAKLYKKCRVCGELLKGVPKEGVKYKLAYCSDEHKEIDLMRQRLSKNPNYKGTS